MHALPGRIHEPAAVLLSTSGSFWAAAISHCAVCFCKCFAGSSLTRGQYASIADGCAGRGHIWRRGEGKGSRVCQRRRNRNQTLTAARLRAFLPEQHRGLAPCQSLPYLRTFRPCCYPDFDLTLQVKNFKTYVKREIVHQSSLKHPFIVSLKEVRTLFASTAYPEPCRLRQCMPWAPCQP